MKICSMCLPSFGSNSNPSKHEICYHRDFFPYIQYFYLSFACNISIKQLYNSKKKFHGKLNFTRTLEVTKKFLFHKRSSSSFYNSTKVYSVLAILKSGENWETNRLKNLLQTTNEEEFPKKRKLLHQTLIII